MLMTTFVCRDFIFICLLFCYCIYFAIVFVDVDSDDPTSCFFLSLLISGYVLKICACSLLKVLLNVGTLSM